MISFQNFTTIMIAANEFYTFSMRLHVPLKHSLFWDVASYKLMSNPFHQTPLG